MEAAEVVKLDFVHIKQAVAEQFEKMQKHPMFRVDVDKDLMWETYLASFPPGTNPQFRTRTEHDCGCCKGFIRAVGNVVAIINGKIETIWDGPIKKEPAYGVVAKAMADLIRSKPIVDTFLSDSRTAGVDRNFEKLVEGQKTWNHFFVNIGRQFVMNKADIPTKLNVIRTAKAVFLRGLKELTIDSLDTVLELMAQNSVYRILDFKFQVKEFYNFKKRFDKLTTDEDREIFAWVNMIGLPEPVVLIRNKAIGTLLVDLSEGMDLEDAVKKFETSTMAPTNYKRPTALVSKQQIEKAKQTLTELGLVSSLERRFATIDDITVNNVLFRDREVKAAMGDVFDDLAASTPSKAKTMDKVDDVPIEKFISDILPRAQSIEVLLENQHANNLVSLITAVDPTSATLFKWDNKFSWSYHGNVADSIKERVKKAGGSITGDLCCRLAWDYRDDLDFHMREPGGHEIYYSNRRRLSPNGGMLDVDANGVDGERDDPVENIYYADKNRMREGTYQLWVNNYSRRDSGGEKRGFTVEIEFGGQTFTINYDKVLRSQEDVQIATITYSKKEGFKITNSLPSSASIRTVWGIQTQNFHKVSVMMMSPNFWDEKAVGAKHYFFMLDKCVNDGSARGFYNEFLKAELEQHRKVLEMIGGKMPVADSNGQLSGLGFSHTKKDALIARVKGSFTRQVRIVF